MAKIVVTQDLGLTPKNIKKLNHPKVLVTPHIAYNTDITDEVSNKMMIENIEAWLNKNPINILE